MFLIFFIFTKKHFLSEKIAKNLKLLDSLRKFKFHSASILLNTFYCILNFKMYFLNAFSEAIFGGKIFFLHRCSFYVLNFPFQVIHIRICEILSNLINLILHLTKKLRLYVFPSFKH